MIALQEYSSRFTPEEYFAWEEQQELKHEYIDGEVYAMSGGTLNHSRITTNFSRLLGNHLDDGRCTVFNSDARVKIHESSKYVYPDTSVTCDERDRNNTQFINHPCLIIEVLSPSTELYDRVKKFKLYRRSPSLRDYVLVNANEIEIDLHHKNDMGRWEELNYVAGDIVEIESINLTFQIEQIYKNITFENS